MRRAGASRVSGAAGSSTTIDEGTYDSINLAPSGLGPTM